MLSQSHQITAERKKILSNNLFHVMYNSLVVIRHGEDLKSAYKSHIATNLNYYYIFFNGHI